MGSRWTAWRSGAAIVVLALAVGLQTVRGDNYFLGDDFGLVQHLHDQPAGRLLSYFGSDWTEGIYGVVLDEQRPILAFTYWLDAQLFGATSVAGYHATNLVLHLLNSLLVLAIARAIAPGEPAFAALAAALFVLMPSHAEPIAWISGRVDSLAALFYLGAFLCFVRFRLAPRPAWLIAALLIFACGLFAKQSLVTLPAAILAFDLLGPRSADGPARRSAVRLWPHLPFLALVASYLALRHALFGNAVREDTLTLAVIREFIGRQDRYVRELLPTPNAAPRALKTVAEVLSIGAVAVCGRWLLAGRRAWPRAWARLWFFGAVWYAITIAPMVVTYASARHLYITTAGVSIALASLLLPGAGDDNPRRRKRRTAIVGLVVVLYAVAAIWNVATWVGAGTESRRFASAVPRLLQSVPRGSVVLLSVPEWYRDGWFWSWATPFALQPPFTAADLYEQFKIVERPPVYCCPPDQWWAARKTSLLALLDAPSPQQVASIVFDGQNRGTPTFTIRTVDGRALKQRIERVLGKPVDSLTAITPAEAQELSRLLFE